MMDFHAIQKRLEQSEIIGYGPGAALAVTLETANINVAFAVGDDPELWGQSTAGVPIRSPEVLATVDKERSFVVVFAYTPQAIQSIRRRLESMGFEHGRHWIDCSVLHFSSIALRLKETLRIDADLSLFHKTQVLSHYAKPLTQSGAAGTWLFEELARRAAASVPGSFAELGVFQGGNAFVANTLLGDEIEGRPYHLFDSFEGFPTLSHHDPASRAGDFKDTSLEEVRSMFSHFPNTHIHVGFFSDTLADVADERFSLVYVDCDLYEPAVECCAFFYDRLNPGGFLLFHDYYTQKLDLPPQIKAPFDGITRAVNAFLSDKPESIIPFPETSHALFVKA